MQGVVSTLFEVAPALKWTPLMRESAARAAALCDHSEVMSPL